MREIEIEIEEGEACSYEDNAEKIDPDKAFSYFDKRIHDALGHYQKDFMGGVSADNLGRLSTENYATSNGLHVKHFAFAFSFEGNLCMNIFIGPRWGGYGSFLSDASNSPISSHPKSRTQINSSSRPLPNPTSEDRFRNFSAQTNQSLPVRLQPASTGCGVHSLPGPATSSSDNLVRIKSSGDGLSGNQHKILAARFSDSTKLRVTMGSEKISASDLSEIYSGLGLDISPSSSLGDSPPSGIDATFPRMDEMLENSPTVIVKVMTSFPVPENCLLSPLPDDLVSLKEKKFRVASLSEEGRAWVKNGTQHSHEAFMDKDIEPISTDKSVGLIKEEVEKKKKSGQVNLLEKNHEYIAKTVDFGGKRKEESRRTRKEPVLESPAAFNMLSDDKDASSIMDKDSISGTYSSYVKQKNTGGHAEVVVDAAKSHKQSHKRQGKVNEQANLVASSGAAVEESGKYVSTGDKFRQNKKVISALKEDVSNDDPCENVGNQEDTCAVNWQVKHLAEEILPDSVSSQEVGMHDMRKIDRQLVEFHQDKEACQKVARDDLERGSHEGEEGDSLQGSKDHLCEDKYEPPKEVYAESCVPQFQNGSNFSYRRDCQSAKSEEKAKKGQSGGQSSVVWPKVSFKVGSSSSSLQGQNTDQGIDSFSSGLRDDLESQKDLRKGKEGSIDSAGKKFKKKKKIMSMNYSGIEGPEGENLEPRNRSKDKSGSKQPQCSKVGLSKKQDLINNKILLEKGPSSSVAPMEALPLAPVLIKEDWVQCDRCHTWRLLPLHITPDDLPKKWLCSMLNWLPGMNKCSFTEEQTRDAVLALYQPVPPTQETHNGLLNTEISHVPLVESGSDVILSSRKKRQYSEVSDNVKRYQRHSVELGSKKTSKQSSSVKLNAAQRNVIIGKKRDHIQDAPATSKKPKKEYDQSTGDRNPDYPPLATDSRKSVLNQQSFLSQTSNDFAVCNPFVAPKKLKGSQQSANFGLHQTVVSMKKRNLKDMKNDPVGNDTELLEKRKLKRRKEAESQEKKSNTNRGTESNDHGLRDRAHQGSLRKEDKPFVQRCERNTTDMVADCRKSSKSNVEIRKAATAPTSSSTKISSKVKGMNDRSKFSPAGSFSSSPLKVSRSDHDRSRIQTSISQNEHEESSLTKKKIVEVMNDTHITRRRVGKDKKENDPDFKTNLVGNANGTEKMSSGTHVGDSSKGNHQKLEAYDVECKEFHSGPKDKETSHKNSASADQVVRSKGLVEDKISSKNIDPKGRKILSDTKSGSEKELPSSSNQFVEFEEGDGMNTLSFNNVDMSVHKLVSKDAEPSSSGKKNVDRAARTALKEAKDLKHSADRLKISGSGLESTSLFFQAALKFLHGASLLENGGSEENRCGGGMKSTEVYSTTAKLCEYCAHEFEKSNDMASAALAYKCMEIAYLRVLYTCMEVTVRDAQLLRMTERTIPQVDSPSSSASDVDNVHHPASDAAAREIHSSANHGNIVISAGNQASYLRTLDFIDDVHSAMDAARKSLRAFAAAHSALVEAGNEEGIASLKRVIHFSFNNVDEFLLLVRLAMEAVG